MRPFLFCTLFFIANIPNAQVIYIAGNGKCSLDTNASRISILPSIYERINKTLPAKIILSKPGYFHIGNEFRYLSVMDTAYINLEQCETSFSNNKDNIASQIFTQIEAKSAVLFAAMDKASKQEEYQTKYETLVIPAFKELDSLIQNQKRLDKADRLQLTYYLLVKKMMTISVGIHNADSSIKQMAFILLLEHTPPFDISSVGSGKNSLVILSGALSTNWPQLQRWINKLSEIDKLFVSLYLFQSATFGTLPSLPASAQVQLKTNIYAFNSELNTTEADILIAVKQKLSLKGKGADAMFGTMPMYTMSGKKIMAKEIPINTKDTSIIYFWATWCGPCVAYIKNHLANSSNKPKHIFVSLDAEEDKWKRLSTKIGIPEEINLQLSQPFISSFRKQFHIESLPAKFILTKNGFQFL